MSGMTNEEITHQVIFDKLVMLEKRTITLGLARDKEHRAIQQKLDDMAELLEAWRAVQTGGRFVKWLAGIITGIGVIFIAVKAFAGYGQGQ